MNESGGIEVTRYRIEEDFKTKITSVACEVLQTDHPSLLLLPIKVAGLCANCVGVCVYIL